MNRREFSLAAASALALAAVGWPQAVLAQGRRPEEGTDYVPLDKRAPVDAPPGKIEVVDFFWYSCPHCNAFEPKLQAWIAKLPADVSLKRIPVGFRDDFVPQQRMFYALDAMGKLDELHTKIFRAIHVEHIPVDKENVIVEWLGHQGVDTAKFRELYNSFAVSAKARRATQIQDAYKVQGVPAIGIAGRWYTDGDLAGNMDRALQITDFLVARARSNT